MRGRRLHLRQGNLQGGPRQGAWRAVTRCVDPPLGRWMCSRARVRRPASQQPSRRISIRIQTLARVRELRLRLSLQVCLLDLPTLPSCSHARARLCTASARLRMPLQGLWSSKPRWRWQTPRSLQLLNRYGKCGAPRHHRISISSPPRYLAIALSLPSPYPLLTIFVPSHYPLVAVSYPSYFHRTAIVLPSFCQLIAIPLPS